MTTERKLYDPTGRLPAIEIIIHRAEGPIHRCRTARFGGATCWDDAEAHLMKESWSAPQHGGYDKCDVTITFVADDTGDQLVYRTRYDLVHLYADSGYEGLAEHVRRSWEFYAGRYIPHHMTRERWEGFVRSCNVNPDEWAKRCDAYDVPGINLVVTDIEKE